MTKALIPIRDRQALCLNRLYAEARCWQNNQDASNLRRHESWDIIQIESVCVFISNIDNLVSRKEKVFPIIVQYWIPTVRAPPLIQQFVAILVNTVMHLWQNY